MKCLEAAAAILTFAGWKQKFGTEVSLSGC
jgi:hypothetical protein